MVMVRKFKGFGQIQCGYDVFYTPKPSCNDYEAPIFEPFANPCTNFSSKPDGTFQEALFHLFGPLHHQAGIPKLPPASRTMGHFPLHLLSVVDEENAEPALIGPRQLRIMWTKSPTFRDSDGYLLRRFVAGLPQYTALCINLFPGLTDLALFASRDL